MLSSQVSDLDTNVDLSGMTFIDDTAFVIWKWSWKKEFSFDGDDAEAEEEEDKIVVIPRLHLFQQVRMKVTKTV